ncbi:DUF4169 family protein [Methylocystis parvus]|uniref:DUF4169 family protein n=1 Tax=Methylocystis parvus TaxID=134 RepID=UPI003C70EF14
MGEVINLRRARKARERREKEEAAQANRVAFGRTKAERTLTDAQKRLDAVKLDAHKRETPEEPA